MDALRQHSLTRPRLYPRHAMEQRGVGEFGVKSFRSL